MADGVTLGTAFVQIVPSARGIKGSLTQALGGEAEKAGVSAGSKIAAFAKKAIIYGSIGKALMMSLKEGAALEQSYLGGLDTLYGEAADSARRYAREAAAAGVSMNTYAEQAVSFGAALKAATGDERKAAEAANVAILDMADNAAKMGTDITMIQNAYQGFAKQNYMMLDNLKLGYGGTKTEMERLLRDAEKLSGVKYDISNLADVYAAIHVIQEDLGLTGVAAYEASETLLGSFNAMKAGFQNLLGSLALGENVGKAMSSLVTSTVDFAFKNLIPMTGTILSQLPSAIITFLKQGVPLLVDGLVNLMDSIGNKISGFANSLGSEKTSAWISEMLPKIVIAAGKLIGEFAYSLISNIDKIIGAIGRIGYTLVGGLGSALWGKVTEAANGIVTRFLAPIKSLQERIRAIVSRIKSFFHFKISAPKIPLPHFGINPAGWKLGDLLKGVIPSLKINWRAKGGIFDGPELIGAGEAGREILTPEKLLRQITAESNETTNDILTRILNVMVRIAESEQSLELNNREVGKIIRGEMNTLDRRDKRKLGYI